MQMRDQATRILMDSLVEQGAQTKDGTTIWKALCAMNKDNPRVFCPMEITMRDHAAS